MSAEDRFAGTGVAGYRHAERSYLSQDSSCSTRFELDVVSLGGMMIVNRFLFFLVTTTLPWNLSTWTSEAVSFFRSCSNCQEQVSCPAATRVQGIPNEHMFGEV